MTGTGGDVFAPFLLDGERIIWRGSAVWKHAAHPPRRILSFLSMLTLSVIAFFGASLVTVAGDSVEPNSFLRSLYAVGMLVSFAIVIYLSLRTVSRFFALFTKPDPRQSGDYLLTDQRLIIVSGEPPTAYTISRANVLLEAILSPNGAVHDLKLWFGPKEDDDYFDYADPTILFALENGEEAKRQILQAFRLRRDLSQRESF